MTLKLLESDGIFLDFDGNSDVAIGVFHDGLDELIPIVSRKQMQSGTVKDRNLTWTQGGTEGGND